MEAASTQRRRALLHLGAPPGCTPTTSVSETVIEAGCETRSQARYTLAPVWGSARNTVADDTVAETRSPAREKHERRLR